MMFRSVYLIVRVKDRFVYLSQAALDALQAYREVRGEDRSLPEALFLYRHEALSSRYCAMRLNTYGDRCGVRITPHQLRHSCATLLLNAGAPVLTVQAILGHKNINTTMNYARLYDGTIAEDYFQAMKQVESRLALETPAEIPSKTSSYAEVLVLINTLQGEAASEAQSRLIEELKLRLEGLMQDVKVLANTG